MIALAVALVAIAQTPSGPRKMSMDDCVREALGSSGQVMEARGKVVEWEGRLKEVESTFWPKLVGLTYLAPLYGLNNVVSPSPDQIPTQYYRDLNSWGPYIKFQAVLAEPISTFGREAAGEEAARERVMVEEARFQQVRNFLALDVRRYYLLHIYARSFLPALDLASRLVGEAYDKASESYASGDGSVTQVDLNKLKFGKLELEKARAQADIGQALALAALKHTMGMQQDAAIETIDIALPPIPTVPIADLKVYVAQAADHRPELAELFHGERAAKAFELSERLSSNPTAFAAASIDLNWSSQFPQETNPWAFSPFNSITPMVELGLQVNIDVMKTYARSYGAKGLIEQVEGLKKFAETGIPLEVLKAYDETLQAEALTRLSDQEASAAKKWLVFAGAGYSAGTGEAKDVLEGLVAYMTAKKGYYDSLQAVHLSRATLLYSTGLTGVE